MKAKLKLSWDFNRTEIEKDTEVTIIKGMEADADSVLNAPYGMCYLCELDGVMSYVPAIYLIITDWDNIDWEQRRYEIAKECVAVLMSSEMTLEDAAKVSVEQADALITELKKRPAIIETKSQVVDRVNPMSLEKNRLELQNLEVRTKVSQ